MARTPQPASEPGPGRPGDLEPPPGRTDGGTLGNGDAPRLCAQAQACALLPGRSGRLESSPQGGFATSKAPEAARAWERRLLILSG